LPLVVTYYSRSRRYSKVIRSATLESYLK